MSQDLIEKPEKPAPNECCGGGSCCPCVWDHYFEQLEIWKRQQGQETNTKKPQKKEQPDSDTFYR